MRYNYTDRALKEQVGEGGNTGSGIINVFNIEVPSLTKLNEIFTIDSNKAWAKEIIKTEELDNVLNYKVPFWNCIKDEYYNNVLFSLYDSERLYIFKPIINENSIMGVSTVEISDGILTNVGIQYFNNKYYNVISNEFCIPYESASITVDFSKDTQESEIFKTAIIDNSLNKFYFFNMELIAFVDDENISTSFYWNELNPVTCNISLYSADEGKYINYTLSITVTTQARTKMYRAVLTKVAE